MNKKNVNFSAGTQKTNLFILLENYRLLPVLYSFSSSNIPLHYKGNQEYIELNRGSTFKRLSDEYDSTRGQSLVIQSAQNLEEEWEKEFVKGLNLIANSRPAYAKKIKGKGKSQIFVFKKPLKVLGSFFSLYFCLEC